MFPEGCRHFPTHPGNNRWRLAMATNHQGYEEPCDACINAGWFPPWPGFIAWALHAVSTHPTQCACGASTCPRSHSSLKSCASERGPSHCSWGGGAGGEHLKSTKGSACTSAPLTSIRLQPPPTVKPLDLRGLLLPSAVGQGLPDCPQRGLRGWGRPPQKAWGLVGGWVGGRGQALGGCQALGGGLCRALWTHAEGATQSPTSLRVQCPVQKVPMGARPSDLPGGPPGARTAPHHIRSGPHPDAPPLSHVSRLGSAARPCTGQRDPPHIVCLGPANPC